MTVTESGVNRARVAEIAARFGKTYAAEPDQLVCSQEDVGPPFRRRDGPADHRRQAAAEP